MYGHGMVSDVASSGFRRVQQISKRSVQFHDFNLFLLLLSSSSPSFPFFFFILSTLPFRGEFISRRLRTEEKVWKYGNSRFDCSTALLGEDRGDSADL